MANLKKHFVFKVGSSASATAASVAAGHAVVSSGELLPPGFSKSAFMNEVSSLLDHCGIYVSAMNGFCTSGCSLAKCLVRVFHAVPLYRETASTLLSNWEEIAQTTAAASASVKTETLMQLQDVLTRLETSGESKEDELAESVHAVSSCLMAYIELQAQFSYSVFKSLGKLSRQQQNGLLRTSRAEDTVRKHFSQIINRLTGPSVKAPQQTQLSALWPTEIHLAPSNRQLVCSQPESPSVSNSSRICLTNEALDSGLDDVINLLSIGAPSSATAAATAVSSSSSSPPPPLPLLLSSSSLPVPSPAPSLPSPVVGSIPPKVPPRPDTFSIKQLKMAAAAAAVESTPVGDTSAKSVTPPWSPWGSDWSTKDLSNWPSHLSDGSNYSSDGWNSRWQSASAKEKTQTWPRPLRDPSAPWEWLDDEMADMADTWKAGNRDGERAGKTSTWPLKVAAETSWQEVDSWQKDDSLPTASQAASHWKDDVQQEFNLFNQQ